MVLTGDLSNNTKQRIFGAEFPPELKAGYTRLPEIENQIAECLAHSEADFRRRLAVNEREANEFLREETLACLLTLAHSGGLFEIEGLIAEKLYKSCEKRVVKVLRKNSFDENFIEEAVGEIQFLMLKQIFVRTEKSYDFWEARFYKALNLLISGYRRRHIEKYQATELFSELSEDGETDYEDRLADEGNSSGRREKLLASRQILARMPKDLRQIFALYYVDEETQEAIAETFGITARTIRNKLRLIGEFLDDWRGDSQGDIK